MRRNGLVESTRGPGGGYRLGKAAADISVAEIITAVDEPMDATNCEGRGDCDNGHQCMTHDLWAGLNKHMFEYLQAVNLATLVEQQLQRPLAAPVRSRPAEASEPASMAAPAGAN